MRLPALASASGVGKAMTNRHGALGGPVVEGLQGRRVVLVQGGPELVDQGGALLDQRDLVAAEHAQLGGQRVLGQQRPPAVAVGAQGVGEAPGVQRVVLGAGGRLAVAVPLGGLGVHRVDAPGPGPAAARRPGRSWSRSPRPGAGERRDLLAGTAPSPRRRWRTAATTRSAPVGRRRRTGARHCAQSKPPKWVSRANRSPAAVAARRRGNVGRIGCGWGGCGMQCAAAGEGSVMMAPAVRGVASWLASARQRPVAGRPDTGPSRRGGRTRPAPGRGAMFSRTSERASRRGPVISGRASAARAERTVAAA